MVFNILISNQETKDKTQLQAERINITIFSEDLKTQHFCYYGTIENFINLLNQVQIPPDYTAFSSYPLCVEG